MGIIKPEGSELLTYIRNGYFICSECDTLMDLDGDELVCPSCGYSVYREDYNYDYEEYFDNNDDINPPTGCAACGGPYPSCKTSCKMFDD